jgi:hypothetical protein
MNPWRSLSPPLDLRWGLRSVHHRLNMQVKGGAYCSGDVLLGLQTIYVAARAAPPCGTGIAMVTCWGTWDTVARWSRLGWCESSRFHEFSHAAVTRIFMYLEHRCGGWDARWCIVDGKLDLEGASALWWVHGQTFHISLLFDMFQHILILYRLSENEQIDAGPIITEICSESTRHCKSYFGGVALQTRVQVGGRWVVDGYGECQGKEFAEKYPLHQTP